MSLIKLKKIMPLLGAFLVLFFGGTELAMAATQSASGFGSIGDNLAAEAVGMANGVKMIAFLVGVILVVTAIVMIANAKKTNQPIGGAIMMMIAGFALISLFAIIGSGSSTIWGGDQSDEAMGDLGLD